MPPPITDAGSAPPSPMLPPLALSSEGAIVVACVTSTFLYGATLLLILQYFKSHAKSDPWHVKMTVGILGLLVTLVSVFVSFQLYDMLITRPRRMDMALADEIGFYIIGEYICEALTAVITQIFFAIRIWKVGKNLSSALRYIALPVVVLSCMQLGCGLVQVVVFQKTKFFSRLSDHQLLLNQTTTIQSTSSILCDVSISLGFSIILHSHRSGIQRTNSLVNKLILYAINRAVATGVCAIISTALIFKQSTTYYSLIPLLAICYLYVISTVSVLTSREGLRQEEDPTIRFPDLTSTVSPPRTISDAEEEKYDNALSAVPSASSRGTQTSFEVRISTDELALRREV
ncbi:hypothetical protein D9613_004666 [Agrocybe pediades]|uniref:DUF6534 domain-containing protein n=1 Tax=Agrocybe pediades TaxID=84607 RepID=A0A8H4VR88_9AGAR|nr:hypothetical protein D9613_004666 [Agrocybe pediades]